MVLNTVICIHSFNSAIVTVMLKTSVAVIFLVLVHNLFLTNLIESRVTITNLTVCKGPKRKDCSINEARVINDTILNYAMQIVQDVRPNKGKLTIYTNGKLLTAMQLKKPCENLFLKPLIKLTVNMPRDCRFKKGNHSFNYNMEQVLRNGGIFLTDRQEANMTASLVFYSDDCNFSCTVFNAQIHP